MSNMEQKLNEVPTAAERNTNRPNQHQNKTKQIDHGGESTSEVVNHRYMKSRAISNEDKKWRDEMAKKVEVLQAGQIEAAG